MQRDFMTGLTSVLERDILSVVYSDLTWYNSMSFKVTDFEGELIEREI